MRIFDQLFALAGDFFSLSLYCRVYWHSCDPNMSLALGFDFERTAARGGDRGESMKICLEAMRDDVTRQ
jgi:hypothetical protein